MMKDTMFEVSSAQREMLQQGTIGGRVALIFYFQVRDRATYNCWLEKSTNLLDGLGSKRFFSISVDPAPREGMSIDEIIIDEYPSAEVALKFVAASQADLNDSCSDVTVLARRPADTAASSSESPCSRLPVAGNWAYTHIAKHPAPRICNCLGC